jgi:site-specific DNA-cytosine methylase
MQDVVPLLKEKWDMIIAFPPCTYLTVTGNRWFNVEKYGEQALKRAEDRKEAIEFFKMFANADCEKIAIENPVGIMSTELRKPNQIINPYQFGDPFEKKTCLWLKGLPELIPTNIVDVPPRKQFESGKSMPAWYADAFSLPKEERAKLRSKTFPGIAKAMAEQWGNLDT